MMMHWCSICDAVVSEVCQATCNTESKRAQNLILDQDSSVEVTECRQPFKLSAQAYSGK